MEDDGFKVGKTLQQDIWKVLDSQTNESRKFSKLA
jgi:hypothetical protein